MNRVPFDPNESNYTRAQASGHLNRTGHALTGHYVISEGMAYLVRTCGCDGDYPPNLATRNPAHHRPAPVADRTKP